MGGFIPVAERLFLGIRGRCCFSLSLSASVTRRLHRTILFPDTRDAENNIWGGRPFSGFSGNFLSPFLPLLGFSTGDVYSGVVF